MRVLMLNPSFGKNFVRSARWAARSRGRVQRHPDYLAIGAAVLENEGHRVKLLDAAALNLNFDETKEIAREFKPNLSVIHTTTPSIYSDIKYAEMLKDGGSITVLIGQHASALPIETIQLSEKIDCIARGEYDYTLRDIARGKNPRNIPGVTYRDGSEIIANKDRPLIENLDELPFPAWHQIDIHDYFDAGKLYPFITMISGRGCPNNCSFCVLPQVFYGKKYRLRSVKKVVDEIEYDLELFPDLKEVMFEDDTLTADRKRCTGICNEILERGIKISWSANARADLDDLGLLRLMKKAGCRMLVIGYEFGDQQILNNVRKRLTVEQMKYFSKITKYAGIKVHGCFMIGGPGETRESAEKTVQLAKGLKPDTLQFSALTPYPGTKFYKWCKEKGYIIARDWPDWVDAGEQSTVIRYPNLSREEIVELVDRGLYDNFYFRPSVWIYHLVTINSFDDFKRKLKGVRNLIDYWWSRRKRKVINIQDEVMRKEWEIFWNAKRNSQFTKIRWSKIRIMRILDKYVIKRMTVLDAGSGSGFFSNYFVSKGCKVYSLDYSKKALEITKRITRGKSFKYLNTDLLDANLGFQFKDMFDLIFTDGLFEHFPSKKQKQIMENFLAMKRKKGIIITFVPNKYSFWTLIRSIFMGRIDEKPFTLRELTLFVGNTGQKVIESGGINVLPIKYSPEILGKDIGMLIYTASK